jgi:hypothetical protein
MDFKSKVRALQTFYCLLLFLLVFFKVLCIIDIFKSDILALYPVTLSKLADMWHIRPL